MKIVVSDLNRNDYYFGEVWSRRTGSATGTRVVIRHKKTGKYIKGQGRSASLVDDFKDAHVWNRMGDASNALHHVIHAYKIKKELQIHLQPYYNNTKLSADDFEKLTCNYSLDLWETIDEEVEIISD